MKTIGKRFYIHIKPISLNDESRGFQQKMFAPKFSSTILLREIEVLLWLLNIEHMMFHFLIFTVVYDMNNAFIFMMHNYIKGICNDAV